MASVSWIDCFVAAAMKNEAALGENQMLTTPLLILSMLYPKREAMLTMKPAVVARAKRRKLPNSSPRGNDLLRLPAISHPNNNKKNNKKKRQSKAWIPKSFSTSTMTCATYATKVENCFVAVLATWSFTWVASDLH